MRRQCGGLQVGEHARDRIRPARVHRPCEGALRPDENGAGDEEFGDVDVEQGRRRSEGRRREVDQHRTVSGDDDVARVESAVTDARIVKPGDLAPEVVEHVVADLVAGRQLERLEVRLTRHDQRVVIRAEPDGHDRRRAHAGLSGE